jgi:hypothetical protein
MIFRFFKIATNEKVLLNIWQKSESAKDILRFDVIKLFTAVIYDIRNKLEPTQAKHLCHQLWLSRVMLQIVASLTIVIYDCNKFMVVEATGIFIFSIILDTHTHTHCLLDKVAVEEMSFDEKSSCRIFSSRLF